jgi:hypothetical protein
LLYSQLYSDLGLRGGPDRRCLAPARPAPLVHVRVLISTETSPYASSSHSFSACHAASGGRASVCYCTATGARGSDVRTTSRSKPGANHPGAPVTPRDARAETRRSTGTCRQQTSAVESPRPRSRRRGHWFDPSITHRCLCSSAPVQPGLSFFRARYVPNGRLTRHPAHERWGLSGPARRVRSGRP